LQTRQSLVLTPREIQVINKKIHGKKLTQQDSNYISRYVRPKLKEIEKINALSLLSHLEYNQKAISIEKKIKKVLLDDLGSVDSITLYGSAIQNNYTDYNDTDVLVIVKKPLWKSLREKYKKISGLKNHLKEKSINIDLQILDKKTFIASYPSSPSLIYQLKDNKVIYGKLELPQKKQIYKIDLNMKLDWSNIENISPRGIDIYKAIRNAILVQLLCKGIVDNQILIESIYQELGKNLIEKLKNNKESKIQRRYALYYLKELLQKTRQQIKGDLWEKIEL
jgi:predicted nucleotidyltransferase